MEAVADAAEGGGWVDTGAGGLSEEAGVWVHSAEAWVLDAESEVSKSCLAGRWSGGEVGAGRTAAEQHPAGREMGASSWCSGVGVGGLRAGRAEGASPASLARPS